MALHGSQDAPKRPQPARPDELLPAGSPPDARPAADRDEHGKLVPGPGTTEQAAAAARERWRQQRLRQRLAATLGLETVHPDLATPVDLGVARRDDVRDELVDAFGEAGPLLDAFLEDAGLCRALAVYWASKAAGDLDAAKEARLATVAGRGHLIAAREYAAKNAQARPKGSSVDRMRKRLGIAPAQPQGGGQGT